MATRTGRRFGITTGTSPGSTVGTTKSFTWSGCTMPRQPLAKDRLRANSRNRLKFTSDGVSGEGGEQKKENPLALIMPPPKASGKRAKLPKQGIVKSNLTGDQTPGVETSSKGLPQGRPEMRDKFQEGRAGFSESECTCSVKQVRKRAKRDEAEHVWAV